MSGIPTPDQPTAAAVAIVPLTRAEMQRRREQLKPLNEVLLLDPLAAQLADRYVTGRIPGLVDCLFQLAIHCSAVMRESQARELELIRRGFAMRHREF